MDTVENITNVLIESEMQKSYLDYAMSVIIGRALPDVRDGFKPAHRRSLFAMRELGIYYNRSYVKSARIVGDIIGKYHPHGDVAAYDTIVRMAQDFSMRYPLVDGQGNFGSMDGDSAAAMRYTEARMTRIDMEIIDDLDKETVDFVPNYDNSLKEPSVLPTKIPNLLINGSSGIAVGMATNIPPHNLTEVIDGLTFLIDNPDASIQQISEIITGPDFPTGGLICGRSGIREAYETGRGVITLRALTHVETHKGSSLESIIIDEIPYQQNKAVLVRKIAELIKDKRIESISDIRDESDRHGVRIVLDLKKDEYSEVVLNQLYKLTPLQKSFGIIFLAIVNNKPEVLNIKQILQHFVSFRNLIVFRRTSFELRKAEERAHFLEGLSIAVNNMDEVVELIKKSESPQVAKEQLISRFSLSDIQAQAILDMRLQRLTGLERDKIIEEYKNILEEIGRLKKILADDSLLMQIVKDEFQKIKELYGDSRKTEIIDSYEEINAEDLIAPEEMVITVTHSGYIKRNSLSLYRSQKRGGKGVIGVNSINDDFVSDMYIASTLDYFLFFTNYGKVFWRKVYELPIAGRNAKGKALVNFLELSEGEKVATILPLSDFDDPDNSKSIFFVTKCGVVKKTSLQEFTRPLRKGKRAITIRENDEIISAHLLSGSDTIFLISSNGMCIHFSEDNIRVMGRNAAGVRGMRLSEDDTIVGALVVTSDESILTVTENGFGKRTAVNEYKVQNRGGKGIHAIKASERNGKVVGALQVSDSDEVMIIANSGKIIRMDLTSVRVIGRATQGVRLINMEEGEKVVSMDIVDSLGEEGDNDIIEEDNE